MSCKAMVSTVFSAYLLYSARKRRKHTIFAQKHYLELMHVLLVGIDDFYKIFAIAMPIGSVGP